MIPVVLVFRWKTRNQRQDDLWKVVNLQAIPAVGTRIWLNDDGGQLDCSTVEYIELWEHSPQQYEVHLDIADMDVEDDSFEEARDWLKSLGWREGCWWDYIEQQPSTPQNADGGE